MKLALIGYGKMGKLIHDIALQKEHSIVAIIHSTGLTSSITAESVGDADVCIDFSVPETAITNIRTLAKLKKNIVMGTTGWYEHFEEVKNIVHESEIGFLFSPNFSIGVQLFKTIVKEAAKLVDGLEEYDVAGYELHHNQKIDSPSGTAKSIVYTLLEQIKRKTTPIYDLVDRQISPQELHFASVRCGSIPGTHTILFDSPADTITITHQARNREGFAQGAIAAAEWLKDKKGLFTLEDIL